MRMPLDSFPAILAGEKLASSYNIRGTPTFLINGEEATTSALTSRVDQILDARE